MRTLAVVLGVMAIGTNAGAQDWRSVEAAMGRSGVAQAGDVYRFNFFRSDLRVTAAGVRLRPTFALGGWVAFKRIPGAIHGDVAMAMGDLVLTESELAPVISRLQQGGIEQTAIHHHVLRESPRVLYVHIHAMDDPVKIASTIRASLALTRTPAPATANTSAVVTQPLDLDTAAIARALGYAGRENGGVYQVSIPRAENVKDAGFDVPPTMGLATAINFQSTGGGRAAIIGDFVMVASEVNGVIKALRDNGIEVTSLHNHLLEDQPRLFFMHFWANADAVTLARGLRAALDKTNSKR
jgi:hypothetical protein